MENLPIGVLYSEVRYAPVFLDFNPINSPTGFLLPAPGMGSVSRYCISHSAVPVIVVRPEAKVKKSMLKREKDPKRKSYVALLGFVSFSILVFLQSNTPD